MNESYFWVLGLLNACLIHGTKLNTPTSKPTSEGKTTSKLKTMKPSLYKLEQHEREVPGWGVNVHRETIRYIDPVRDTSIISGKEICENSKTEIVIIIHSMAFHWSTREAIRNSWGNLTGPQVKVGFMIGFTQSRYYQKELERESKSSKDIIQENLVEAYYNLTLKSISTLKWFVKNCPKAKFLLKADEDTFVDVPLLVHRLAKYRNSEGILRGYMCSDFERDQRLFSKWYVPKYMYEPEKYPDFLQGSAYYMSRDVAVKLYAAALFTPIFHLEDVYITGLCARKAKVKPEKDEGVEFLFASPVTYCLYPHIITCNSVSKYDLQWVLDERRKLINYSNIDEEPAKFKVAMQMGLDNMYEKIYPEYPDETNLWKTILENGSETSDTPKLAPRSDGRSGATLKCLTCWAYMLLFFV